MAIALKNIVHPNAPARPDRHRHARRRWRPLGMTAVLVVLLLVAAGLTASAIVARVANHRLAALPEYTGRVGRVHLAWWRGALLVRDVELWARGHESDGPILRVDRVSLMVTPSALFRGKLGLRGVVEGADAMLLKTGPAGKPAKTAAEKELQKQQRLAEVRRWQVSLRETFPFEVTRFEIKDSRVRFLDRTVEPNPELAIDQFHLVVTGLGRPADKDSDLPASANLSGVLTGNGRLAVSVQADPLAAQPRFKARLEVQALSLPALKNFMHAYAKADVTSGTFELFSEIDAADGGYDGYIKPFFRDLEFKAVRDENQSALKHLATSAAAAVTSLLKNDEEKVATKVPFHGNFADNKVDVWVTIENLLRNAFVQSIGEGLDGWVQRGRPSKNR